ncbi:MAG: hypothetical protein ABSG28_00510 [Methanoregula sp.]|jgi:hypothetical protein|uniref:hypothetical protein n=1 Tax=Methanoregula sp. TaxID=2052170 RepID=UPI003C15130C
MKSKRFVLLTVLIAVALIVLIAPIANAGNITSDITSASSAKAVSALPLPQLQFNYSQEKVAVTGELSPGKNIRITYGALLTTAENTEELTVPFGSIIYHANNTTTVFDENGQQLFVADDDQAETITTINGDQPATFVHEIPNNSVIVDDGNILQVVYNSARILTIIDSNSNESFIPGSAQTCYGVPYNERYVLPRLQQHE